ILLLFFVSALALTADISPTGFSNIPYRGTFTFTTLEKRTLYLPNGWQFTPKAPLRLFVPIDAFMATISTLWTAAISRARQIPVSADGAAMFQLGSLMLTFNGSLEDRKPLGWETITQFSTKIRKWAQMGPHSGY
ncbi:MAG: hypothetical protein Q9204_003239, partial [Flavoplaca sp. TL-2023a]